MPAVRAWIRRHAVVTYYVLVFVISWGGILILVAPGGIPARADDSAALFPMVYLAMLAGPILGGIVLTGVVHGRAGFREMRARLFSRRVGGRWYAAALLTAPIVMAVTLFALALLSSQFLPGILTVEDKAGLLLFGLAVGLGAGIIEELGWTGFAIPELRRRRTVLSTGLIVGFLWGAWHVLVYFWGSGDSSGAFQPGPFMANMLVFVGILPAFRMLMVWVYDRTRSLLVAMLMHASLTASTQILMPPATGTLSFIYSLVLTGALWGVVAIVTAAARRQLSQQPHLRQAAG